MTHSAPFYPYEKKGSLSPLGYDLSKFPPSGVMVRTDVDRRRSESSFKLFDFKRLAESFCYRISVPDSFLTGTYEDIGGRWFLCNVTSCAFGFHRQHLTTPLTDQPAPL